MDKTIRGLIILLAMSTLLASVVYAAYPSGAGIGNTGSNGWFPVNNPGTVNLFAGNITYADLTANVSTFRWAGLYGNASGSIKLGDSARNVMFNWTALGNMVYASNGTVAWATLADASRANIESVFPFVATGDDAYNATFLGGSESIGSNIFSLNSDYATTMSTGSTIWKTYSLWDGAINEDAVFAGKVVSGGTAYNAQTADYQMIIPENGITGQGQGTATTWNLYIELV